jgi:cyclophilin family peptidyl-prolyl cis-trans isomerase
MRTLYDIGPERAPSRIFGGLISAGEKRLLSPPMTETLVVCDTSFGSFTIALDGARAPKSVANFLRYVDSGHYDGTIFHRVIDGFMTQGGGYDASYTKKSTLEPVENEAFNGVKNVRGTVAMARTSEPHSATAQFFVNVSNNAFLDHKDKTSSGWGYTVFGRVTQGMDVVDKIKSVKTGAQGPFAKDAPLEPVVIQSIKRV